MLVVQSRQPLQQMAAVLEFLTTMGVMYTKQIALSDLLSRLDPYNAKMEFQLIQMYRYHQLIVHLNNFRFIFYALAYEILFSRVL